jgi:inhibitor of cysteine peptidase
MNVSLNNDFILSLESNPTTGYHWEATFSSAFLELKRRDFEVSDTGSIGKGGIEKFTFLPIKTGETEIIMIYKRPWESKPADERSFRIVIDN